MSGSGRGLSRDEAIEQLLRMVKDDDLHDRDCSTAMGPPGPFPCDCGVKEIVLAALGKDQS